MDLHIADAIEQIICKVCFLCDVFSQEDIRTFQFSKKGMTGFYIIISEIKSALEVYQN